MKKTTLIILIVITFIAAFLLGYTLKGRTTHDHAPLPEKAAKQEADIQFWTCSMHPQIRQPNSGQCPICAMDLIPVTSESGDSDTPGPNLTLSETARKLAGVRVSPALRMFVTAEVRMVGKIDFDETRLAYISTRVPGRIDRLFVDYTGTRVKKGDHLVSLYSPELITAQKELLASKESLEETKNSRIDVLRDSTARMVELSREKLRLWGLTPEQIKEIETLENPMEHLTIYSPLGGIVIHKNATEGMYVDTGTRIYTIADLTHLWVRLDAYESDLPFLRYGQDVEFETEAYPGKKFTGKISFIDPMLDEKTHTVKVRVNLPNPDGKLKPGLFVRGKVHARIADGGKVVAPDLAGKWISPMHPEIIKNEPGLCDICGMPLVRTETLGYVGEEDIAATPPLVIPATAPLITGKRAVVYVQKPGEEGKYEGREIVLGHRTGSYYIVRAGLEEGELVVTNGNFKIDSAIQILGKPSMMSAKGDPPPAGHEDHGTGNRQKRKSPSPREKSAHMEIPEAFKKQLAPVFSSYFAMQKSLSGDDFDGAKKELTSLMGSLNKVDMGLLGGDTHNSWMKESADLKKSTGTMKEANSLESFRASFATLSESLWIVAERFDIPGDKPVIRMHCPMAFNNRGADWLQESETVENPYFGSAMLRCGEKVEILSGSGKNHNKQNSEL